MRHSLSYRDWLKSSNAEVVRYASARKGGQEKYEQFFQQFNDATQVKASSVCSENAGAQGEIVGEALN